MTHPCSSPNAGPSPRGRLLPALLAALLAGCTRAPLPIWPAAVSRAVPVINKDLPADTVPPAPAFTPPAQPGMGAAKPCAKRAGSRSAPTISPGRKALPLPPVRRSRAVAKRSRAVPPPTQRPVEDYGFWLLYLLVGLPFMFAAILGLYWLLSALVSGGLLLTPILVLTAGLAGSSVFLLYARFRKKALYPDE